MDYHDLFISCRIGDLDKIRFLVEKRDVELNIRDKWDTTPLYYACLCGHEGIVKYLLENGARCEANTFDGERCLYAALNDSIRKLLRNFKMVTSTTMKRDIFDEFLRRLMNDGTYTDAVFRVLGERFFVHRCVLAARCPQLHEKLRQRLADHKTISIKDLQVDPAAFQMILSYIYTGRMQVTSDRLPAVFLLAKKCGLTDLTHQMEKKLKEKTSFERSKPGVAVDILSIESPSDKQRLVADLTRLADLALPDDLAGPLRSEMPFPPRVLSQLYPDVCLLVEGHKYLCHRLFLCTRSDYFKALLEDHFEENSSDEVTTVHLHDISTAVFLPVLYYIYTDSCELTDDVVYDVLYKADMYLLPGLKRICSTYISKLIDEENVFAVIQLSRMFGLSKLEDIGTEFIADNIEQMVTRKDFVDLILQDAQSIQERQESDSIDVIDSVRYHLTCHVQTYGEIDEANAKLHAIDLLLASLGLDC